MTKDVLRTGFRSQFLGCFRSDLTCSLSKEPVGPELKHLTKQLQKSVLKTFWVGPNSPFK